MKINKYQILILCYILLLLFRPYPVDFFGSEFTLKIILELIYFAILLFYLTFVKFKIPIFFVLSGIIFLFSFFIGNVLNFFLLPEYNDIKDFYYYFYFTNIALLVFFLNSRQLQDNKNICYSTLIKVFYYSLVVIILLNILSLLVTEFRFFFNYLYYQKSSSEIFSDELRLRISGTFTNPNHFGILLSLSIYVLVTFCSDLFSFSRYVFLFLILLTGLVLTGSRTALVILALGFIVLFFLNFSFRILILTILVYFIYI